MNQNYYLCSPWCVWLNYQVPQELINKVDYHDYLKKINTITTYNDLAYYWQESPFKDPHEFLVYEIQSNFNNYTFFDIDGIARNISAINYFRQGIYPTWQDPNNKHGGRLMFQIDKEIDKYKQIYEWLIFYFLGESQSCAQDINGIRFISHKANTMIKFHFRVEIWTKFNINNQAKVQLFKDTFVKDFFHSFLSNNPKLKNFKPAFKNNQQVKQNKQQKKQQKKDQQLKNVQQKKEQQHKNKFQNSLI